MIVVGGGPVGLGAALALRRGGYDVDLLESRTEDAPREGSRALFLHHDTLALLRDLDDGLVERLVNRGVQWRMRRTLFRGRLVHEKEYRGGSVAADGLPPFVSLRQSETEEMLESACLAAGVKIHWAAEVVDVMRSSDQVGVTTKDGRSWSSPYVIGADGARSQVRRSCGLGMEGATAEGFHVVLDVADPDQAPDALTRTFHYEHPALGGRTVMHIPYARGFQVDLQCRTTDSSEEMIRPDVAAEWLTAVVPGADPGRIQWISKYLFHQVVAESMVDSSGRILLAGEAAHLFPPFGARGLNSGLFDAVAVSRAVDGGPDGVAQYNRTRLLAARRNRDAAAEALRHMRPDSVMRIRQIAAAAIASKSSHAARWLERAPYGPDTNLATRY